MWPWVRSSVLTRCPCRSSQAADAEYARLVAMQDQSDNRARNKFLVQQRMQAQQIAMAKQAQQYGLNPNVNLPYHAGPGERSV